MEIGTRNNVVIHGSQGRTELSENGREVELVYEVDRNTFFDYITELAKQNK